MSERKYKPGYYRARGIAGTEQHGFAEGGGDQISLELDVQISDQNIVRLTTILAFAGGALPISIERLKALGWDGSNELRGIDANEVEVEIKYEPKRDNPNEERMTVEIKTQGGRFTFKKPKTPQQVRGFMSDLSKQAAQLAAEVGQRSAQMPPPQRTQQRQPPPSHPQGGPDDFPYGANASQQNYKL